MFILVSKLLPIFPVHRADTAGCGQTKIADLVQIAPDDFRKQSHVAIEDNINAKYANKARFPRDYLLSTPISN